ncbi:unnamed protein product [Lepeophtheirus salmonis]|uniref:(salmon louse) hypothetical protein n=1 Tax=Lepeophtheirus salmonis TaxID=72036 RepID=A0A7R8H9S9_LEPSM|nr:unnamed protein product [Lepeophtheirus salmonis]CAF2959382.1 unnamed protein product [Lepeophtheirus salmonis]
MISVVKLPSGTHISIIENKDDEDGYLEDYMEIVAIKCKLCDFVGGSRGVLRMHLKETHVRSIPPQDKMLIDGLLSLSAPQSVIEEEEESSVYLCAHCSKPFPNKIQCKIHMQKEHKFVQRTFLWIKRTTKRISFVIQMSSRREVLPPTVASSVLIYLINGVIVLFISGRHMGLILAFYAAPSVITKPFTCEKSFKQLAQLKNHMVTHLDKEKDVVPSWYAKKKCELCDKLFSDSKCLKKHVQAVHSKLKPYICQVCNHSTSRKAMLKMHMRQHTGEKPYECDIFQSSALRRHVTTKHPGKEYYGREKDFENEIQATMN